MGFQPYFSYGKTLRVEICAAWIKVYKLHLKSYKNYMNCSKKNYYKYKYNIKIRSLQITSKILQKLHKLFQEKIL